MRRGSALLIVLGMLSFVVASAVGFAAYMRYARLPSSYLRRTSASRLLAKAAMTEAIDVIDVSIGNNTWPGKSGTMIKDYRRETDDINRPADVVDHWVDRCFIGSNALVSVDQTVSTLTVEALAYLPPNLINEARYYSRHSLGATWHTLGFDSGRFAFFAVDVSDYFDVNRVRCNPSDVTGSQMLYGRNSSDDGRLSLRYVFENPSHSGYTFEPDNWDAFTDTYLADGEVPFISLADLHLAMYKRGLPLTMNPFCNYIQNGMAFVTANGRTDPTAHLLRNMNFVTDSWYPVSNDTQRINLASAKDQPFYGYGAIDKADGAQITISSLLNGSRNRFWDRLLTVRSPLSNDPEFVALCDYLDANSVPASLALPTVERTPMITGVILEGAPSVVVSSQDDPERIVQEGQQEYKYITTTYTATLKGDLSVSVGTVYPFKHERGTEKSYAMQAVATIALVPKCAPENEGLLRCENAVAPAVVTCENAWKGIKTSWDDSALKNDRSAVLQCASSLINVPYQRNPKDASEAITKNEAVANFPSLNGLALVSELPATANSYYDKNTCTFRSVRREIKQVDPVSGKETWVPDAGFNDTTDLKDRIGAYPFEKDLSAAVDVNALGGVELIPTVQVWVRICESEKPDNTVDLVPACWRDDKSPSSILQREAKGSSAYPMLRFASDQGLKFDLSAKPNTLVAAGGTGGGAATATPQGYLTDDPRYNYAPENFIALNGVSGELKDLWQSSQRSGAGDRDGDLFMATSDAGYLQSVYELCHIPAISRASGANWGCLDGGYDGKVRSSFDQCPADSAMWRTYSQYDGGWAKNDIDSLGIINGSRGSRVSPYAQTKEIVMAALANTPLDWWSASTNADVNTSVHASMTTADKWAFSDRNPDVRSRIRYEELEQIADNMIAKFRNANETRDWKLQFDEFAWDSAPNESGQDGLCGVDLQDAKLSSVDRKFLHGFWKECFENRQQLFMVFVRAEPMMMGGGMLGQTPPQLGARAMALVWRDPAATALDVDADGRATKPKPHRSRILFYRQFD